MLYNKLKSAADEDIQISLEVVYDCQYSIHKNNPFFCTIRLTVLNATLVPTTACSTVAANYHKRLDYFQFFTLIYIGIDAKVRPLNGFQSLNEYKISIQCICI